MLDVGGADEREIALVRNREDDALVGVLEDVRVVVVEQLAHDDVAALDQPQRACRVGPDVLAQELRRPGPGGVDQRARRGRVRVPPRDGARWPSSRRATRSARTQRQRGRDRRRRARPRRSRQAPPAARRRPSRRNRRSRCENCALQRRAAPDGGAGRPRSSPAGSRAGRGGRRGTARRGSSTPARIERVVRHHEAQRPHDVRRAPQQHLALGQRLAHQRELVVLEVAQPAVDQLGRRRRGVRRQIVLLASSTVRPRPARSRAMPAPLMPPPTTSTSTWRGSGADRGRAGSGGCEQGDVSAEARSYRRGSFRLCSFEIVLFRFYRRAAAKRKLAIPHGAIARRIPSHVGPGRANAPAPRGEQLLGASRRRCSCPRLMNPT